jgi:PAS domain S-box-containing protein
MFDLLTVASTANGFIPHGHCYLWKPDLVSLHVVSDLLTGIAYLVISLTLVYLIRRIKLPFQGIFLAFGLFIASCGATHFMEIWTLWQPVYWLSGGVKLITAIASLTTAFLLPSLVPQIVSLAQSAALAEERRLKLENANQELEALYEKVKQLDQLKTQFFTNISHELRTPLALILGTTEKLLQPEALAQTRSLDLETIDRNARVLLKYVNDLLDISKLEADRLELVYTKVDLVQLVRQTIAYFESFAQQRQIAIALDAPEALWAEVDVENIERVLINLLSNALKFVDVGGVIQCRLEATAERVLLAVEDNGTGVPVELRDVIFDRFQHGSRGETRFSSGTGLGLAIAKEIVELHQGEIRVDAATTGGAVFSIDLPIAAPATARRTDQANSATEAIAQQTIAILQSGIQSDSTLPTASTVETSGNADSQPLVLVVEDNPDMRRLIVETLTDDYRVVTAVNGQDGLQQAIEHRPDLILTDIMMPQATGDELVRAIRANPDLNTTPIILLTAKANDALQVDLLRAGAQDYIMKPFSSAELRVRVNNLVAMKQVRDILQQELAHQQEDLALLSDNASLSKQELQTALAALHRSEARFRRVAESNMIGILFWDRNGRITEANEAFLTTFGYTRADLLAGKVRWREMTPPEYAAQDEQILTELTATGVVSPFEKEYIRQDGSRVSVLVGVALLETADDQGVAFVLDISERKRAEAALKQAYDEMEQRVAERTSELSQANIWLQEQIAEREKAEAALRISRESIQKLYEIVAAQHLDFSSKVQAILALGCDRFQLPLGILAHIEGLDRFFANLHHSTAHSSDATYEVIGVRVQSALPGIPAIVPGAIFPFAETYCQRTIEAGEPVGFEHAGESTEWQQHPCYLNTRLEAYLATPIFVAGEVYGTLNFSSPQPRSTLFTPEDKEFLQLMAQWIGGEIARQRTEEALAQEREFLNVLLNNVNAGIVACDAEGRLTLFNHAACEFHGSSVLPILPQEWTQHYHLFLSDGRTPMRLEEMPLFRAWQGEWIHNQEITIMSQQGKVCTLSVSGQAIVDEQGKKLGAVVISHDITDRKQAEEQVQRLNAELEQRVEERTAQLEAANRAKDEFLATLSHELRTPLNAILGWSQLLRNRQLDDLTRNKALETIERNAKSQAQLVNDILDVSRIIRGKIRLTIRSLHPVAVIEAALDSIRPAAAAKAIQIESSYDTAIEVIKGDPDRLQQVFWNLLSNAIKFTPDGGKVTVRLERLQNGHTLKAEHSDSLWLPSGQGKVLDPSPSEGDYAQITVSDTGQGIQPEFLPHVFDRFRQADGSISRTHSGLGLGLAIVRHLVELHGGTVQAESQGEGQGATFRVTLPLRAVLTPAAMQNPV